MPTSDPWYATSDLPIDMGSDRLAVRVIRSGRIFTAVCEPDASTGDLRWGIPCKPLVAGGDTVEWFRRGWGPGSWQPLDATAWVWPDGTAPPVPLMTPPDRMWSERQSFGAVDDAESADLAREMQRDRDDASRCRDDDDEPPEPAQTWRNIYAVRYEPTGHVTLPMIEARVCRALCYDRLIPPDIKRQRSNAAVLADLKRWFDLMLKDPTDDYRPPFAPTVEDFKDYLQVMAWITEAFSDKSGGWHGSREREIFSARIVDPPRTWEEIGNWYSLSRAAVQKRYARALERILAAANSIATTKAEAEVKAVQARNRAHKRGMTA